MLYNHVYFWRIAELEDEQIRQELVDQKNNIRTITQDLDSNTKVY